MTNPLQEQLLKAGLTTEKKIRKQKHAKGKKVKQPKKKSVKEIDESKLLVHKAEAEKRERDRVLNLKKEQAANQKAIVAQIKQLIDMNQVTSPDGDVVYHFEDTKIVKRIYVTDKVHAQIVQGTCAIVKRDEKYVVVPAVVATKIKQRDPSYIIVLNDAQSDEALDQEYADYAIPDDLMW